MTYLTTATAIITLNIESLFNASIKLTLDTFVCQDVTLYMLRTYADPETFSKDRMDIMFAAVYSAIMEQGLIKDPIDAPIAQDTIFGWIIVGTLEGTSANMLRNCTVLHCCQISKISSSLNKFWAVEEIPQSDLSYGR